METMYVKNKTREVEKDQALRVPSGRPRELRPLATFLMMENYNTATSTEIPLARPVNALPLAPECPPHLDPYRAPT